MYIDVAKENISKVYPKIQAAYKGSSASIYCDSVATPKWIKNDKRYRTHIIGNSLVFINSKEEDSGIYGCLGTLDSYGRTFTRYSELYVGGNKTLLFFFILALHKIYYILHCRVIPSV